MKKNFKRFFLFGCIVTGLTGCGNKQPQHGTSGSPVRDTLCFMSYNTHNCIGLDNVHDYNRIGQVIKSVNPNVVALQELDSVTGRIGDYSLQELADVTGMHASYGPAIDYRGGKYGIGILSKEKPLAFYNIPLPGREEKRTLLVTEFDQYVFCCVHLSLTDDDQLTSVPLIKETLQKYDKPVFFAGDLNAEPQSKTITAIKQEADILTNPGIFTFPADKPTICIDYILQLKGNKPAVQVIETGLVKDEYSTIASDHAPIFTKIVL